MRYATERAALVEYCQRLRRDGLAVGTSGNLSVRAGDLIAVTPSGVDYAELTPERIALVTPEGTWVDGELAPSSETPMHTSVYAGTDAAAVVHTHPLYATALSTVLTELPAVHYLVAQFGGPVRVAGYATYGSTELAERTVAALRDRSAVLLRNHGATTYGPDLATAYTRSIYLEWCCKLYHQARLIGEPSILPDEEIARVVEKFTTYGTPVTPPAAIDETD